MKLEIKNIIAILFVMQVTLSGFSQTPVPDCSQLDQVTSGICGGAVPSFNASSGASSAGNTNPGNDYGCLFTTPNPAWYYLQIGQPGNLDMSLQAASDIDFILYGPFADFNAAAAGCDNYGNGGTGSAIEDCSYSSTSNEIINVTNAQTGEVYVLLITNYANVAQSVTLTDLSSSTATTDCSTVTTPPCVADVGSFDFLDGQGDHVNGNDLYLCDGESFSIVSDQNWTRPTDTIPQPLGDGIYTAQLMWLPYSGPPNMVNGVVSDPANDPNFLGFSQIIPSDNINGTNSASNPLFTALGGCGEYWFVPVMGDDGVGGNNNVANGINDNGGLHWDKDGNGCFSFGEVYKVTFACPIQATPSTNCSSLNNGVDIQLSGGSGSYNIINQGLGNLVSNTVNNGGTAQIEDLTNGQTWNISITDAEGCFTSANGTFGAPTIVDTTFVAAPDCDGPGGGPGTVEVILGSTGTGPYTVAMNGTNTASPYIFTGVGGAGVNVLVTDNLGCTYNDFFTVTSAQHKIIITDSVSTGVLCYGDATGSYIFDAFGAGPDDLPDGTNITSIVWTGPNGVLIYPTIPPDVDTNHTGISAGNYLIKITDDYGCVKTFDFTIESPQQIDIYSTSLTRDPYCFNQQNGEVHVDATGGTPFTTGDQYTYSWNVNNPTQPTSSTSTVTNNAVAGTYWAYVEDAVGCMDSVEIVLNNPPEIEAFFTLKDITCHGIDDGGIIVDSIHNEAGSVQYLWNLVNADNPNGSDPADSINLASGLPPGTYEITIKDETQPTPCQVTYSDLVIEDAEAIDIHDYVVTKKPLCRTNGVQDAHGQISIAVSGGLTTSGTGNDFSSSYWQDNATGATWTSTTYPGIDPGYYSFFAVNELGCVKDTTVYLDSISPIASFTTTSPQFTSDYVGTAPVNVTFTNTSQYYDFANNTGYNGNNPNSDVDTLFRWYFTDADDSTTVFHTESLAPILKDYLSEGLYTVCLEVEENLNHCIDTTCVEIQIYDYPSITTPNVFTPDGDGTNDYFFFPDVAIIDFSAVITDRWGNVMFEFDSIDAKWDGTNVKNGKKCSDGTYFYIYEGESSNGTKYKGQGTVLLLSSGK